MKWQNKSTEDVLNSLNSNNNGLTSGEVKKRQDIYGKNELIEEEKPGFISKFLGQFKDFLIIQYGQ